MPVFGPEFANAPGLASATGKALNIAWAPSTDLVDRISSTPYRLLRSCTH